MDESGPTFRVCLYCKSELEPDARICLECGQFTRHRLLRQAERLLAAIGIPILAVSVSILSYQQHRVSTLLDEMLKTRGSVIETLREMQRIQDELQAVRSKIEGANNLTEKEILLMNYYEVLSRTLAESVNRNPSVLPAAKCCLEEESVKIRRKPSAGSLQIGGVYRGEEVPVLGTFSYKSGDIWYCVITKDNQIGWGYRHFESKGPVLGSKP